MLSSADTLVDPGTEAGWHTFAVEWEAKRVSGCLTGLHRPPPLLPGALPARLHCPAHCQTPTCLPCLACAWQLPGLLLLLGTGDGCPTTAQPLGSWP